MGLPSASADNETCCGSPTGSKEDKFEVKLKVLAVFHLKGGWPRHLGEPNL